MTHTSNPNEDPTGGLNASIENMRSADLPWMRDRMVEDLVGETNPAEVARITAIIEDLDNRIAFWKLGTSKPMWYEA